MSRVVSPREFFDAIARKYDRAYAPPSDVSKAKMARVLDALPKAPARVLDLGVGTGRELPALLDAGFDVHGVDLSAEMIALANKRSRPIEIALADFWAPPLPFESSSFDAAIALHGTLAHPPDDAFEAMQRLSDELARLLRSKGCFVFEVPSPGFVRAVEHGLASNAKLVARDATEHEDPSAGVAVRARAFDADRWIEAFCRHFDVTVEPISEVEQLVVGRRMR